MGRLRKFFMCWMGCCLACASCCHKCAAKDDEYEAYEESQKPLPPEEDPLETTEPEHGNDGNDDD